MALVPVPLNPCTKPLPERVREFLADAVERADAFIEDRRNNPVPGFVCSDYEAVYRILAAVKRERLAPGDFLCEWGCGFGIAAGLAAMLEYRAVGIEIDADLVKGGRGLLRDWQLPVELVRGSFVPPGCEHLLDDSGQFVWIVGDGSDAFDTLGLDSDDSDLVFAYPWPGEEEILDRLFHRLAGYGSLLVTYNGRQECRVQRKVRKK